MGGGREINIDEHYKTCGMALPAKTIQIQAVQHSGDANCGPHSMLFALLESGAIYVQYFSSGRSNVPTDGKWYRIEGAA